MACYANSASGVWLSMEYRKPVNAGAKQDKPVTLWFVRHGKTLLNTLDRVQGWADSPLTDEENRWRAILARD